MDLDEIKERYKLLPIWTRLVLMLILGALPAGYIYLEEGEYLEGDLSAAENERNDARANFEGARTQKGNIQQLEEKLASTEQQLEVAKEKLPDSFLVEDLLQKIAAIGQESGVNFKSFKPEGEPKPGKGEYKYMELPHDAVVAGQYNNIAAFLDRVAHLESTVFVKSIEIKRKKQEEKGNGTFGTAAGTENAHKAAIESRKNTEVEANLSLVAYRSMSDTESATVEILEDGMNEATGEVAPVKE
jgi:type IV pilus assembly protein PilO